MLLEIDVPLSPVIETSSILLYGAFKSPGDELQYVKFDVPPLQVPFTIVASTLPLFPPLQLTSFTSDRQSVGTKGLSTIVAVSKRELHPLASVTCDAVSSRAQITSK